jgi:uncharacterized protein
MSDAAVESLIPYDEIVQEALRAVVGRVLKPIADNGGTLPGRHHFYVTFKTQAPGVDIPAALLARFPDEMTIVLENRFWDLSVRDDGFSVGLSFGGIPNMLHVPFAAITAFVDPGVDFGLQFQVDGDGSGAPEHDDAENDAPDPRDPPKPGGAGSEVSSEDGSNVVTVDFGRRK